MSEWYQVNRRVTKVRVFATVTRPERNEETCVNVHKEVSTVLFTLPTSVFPDDQEYGKMKKVSDLGVKESNPRDFNKDRVSLLLVKYPVTRSLPIHIPLQVLIFLPYHPDVRGRLDYSWGPRSCWEVSTEFKSVPPVLENTVVFR